MIESYLVPAVIGFSFVALHYLFIQPFIAAAFTISDYGDQPPLLAELGVYALLLMATFGVGFVAVFSAPYKISVSLFPAYVLLTLHIFLRDLYDTTIHGYLHKSLRVFCHVLWTGLQNTLRKYNVM